VATRIELDASWLGKCGVEGIEVDDYLVVDLQDGSVVRRHFEVVRSGFANPEACVVIDAKPDGAVGDAGDAVGAFEDLVRHGERVGVDGTDGIERAEIGQLRDTSLQFVHVAAECVGWGTTEPKEPMGPCGGAPP